MKHFFLIFVYNFYIFVNLVKLLKIKSLYKYIFILSTFIASFDVYSQNKDASSLLEIYKIPNENSLIESLYNDEIPIFRQDGKASYYCNKFHMRKTANGEQYNKNLNTAAHRSLPFGTIVRVVNKTNNLSTLVKINDRGPFIKKRIIDLSRKSSMEISNYGVVNVSLYAYIPGTNQFSAPNNYIAYSLSENPFIINTSNINIIDTYDNFQDIYEDYKKLLDFNSELNKNLFILVDINDYNLNPSNVNYILGVLKTFEPKKIPFSIAEKDKK